jgi:4-amino-4-deoxy-L-arabinose transferase-like glycosyltransferase
VIGERGATKTKWIFAAASVPIVFLAHAPLIALPYFWDELGQFVPAALDIFQDGAWIPHSTVPNAHPPGVMAYLALAWRIFGYSIPATRAAMLVLASCAVAATYLLSSGLIRDGGRIATLVPALLLVFDPLFYMQSMMAQLDMPAMLFTLLALFLFFQDRHRAAALACTALVLAKETGALLPLMLAVVLGFDQRRARFAWYYLAPFFVLSLWFFALWHGTGQLFGDAGFTHYNLGYALNPVRASLSLVRRTYYLFFADFRWAGSLAILFAWRGTSVYSGRAWRIAWAFVAAHALMVSVLGGAELERYLLPVIPLLYIAMGAAWTTLRPMWRRASMATVAAGIFVGLFVNPPFPFPFENNLAMVDFVRLHRGAAQFLEQTYPRETIHTAWPLTAALRNPAFGYVDQKLSAAETSDLRYSTLTALDPAAVHVLVLYSRTWEPSWGVLGWPIVARFLARFYEYERQMDSSEVQRHFGLVPIQRWDRRGQWIEIYAHQPAF